MLKAYFDQPENHDRFFEQSELVIATGKDQSSISRAVAELIKNGFLKETEPIPKGKGSVKRIARACTVRELKIPAIRYPITPDQYIYTFGFDLKRVLQIARVEKTTFEKGEFEGYQRPEVSSWINELAEKFRNESTFVTDPVTMCFNKEMVRWTSIKNVKFQYEFSDVPLEIPELGILTIPYCETFFEDEKPAVLVDGQQRAVAARKTTRMRIPVLIVGYIIDIEDRIFKAEEFLKCNTQKNIPSDLLDIIAITLKELKVDPTHDLIFSSALKKRLPADEIALSLNKDPNSPFYEKIRTSVMKEGDITLRSVTEMISTAKSLRPYPSEEQMRLLNIFWKAVANVFPDAWRQSPKKSKLTHGAGMYAMGEVMERILMRFEGKLSGSDSVEIIEKELQRIAPKCKWTQPEWDEFWASIQNTAAHKVALGQYLTKAYIESKKES